MKNLLILACLSFIALSSTGQIVKSERDAGSGLYGFVDKDGKWLVKPEYKYAYYSNCGYGFVTMHDTEIANKKNLYAIIDEKGKRITDYVFSGAFCMCPSDPIIVEKKFDSKTLKGVINRKGKLLIPCGNDEIYIWNPSYFPLPSDDSYHPYNSEAILVVNHNGENEIESLFKWNGDRLLKQDYTSINEWTLSNTTYRVKQNNRYGLFSTKGKLLLDCIYDEIKYSDRYAIPVIDGKTGLYDPVSSKFIIPLQFDDIKFSGIDNIFIVVEKGKYGIYGTNGQIIPCIYSDFSKFQDDVATAVLDGKAVLIKNPLLSDADVNFAELSQDKKTSAHFPAISRYPAPNSDVDKNIPESRTRVSENKFVFIIANENYPEAPVPYALNDGRIFAEYCKKSLGIPSSNICLTEDATYAKIIAIIDRIKEISEAYSGEASIILYYAGHGIPDEQQNSAYMFPIDGQLRNVNATSYSLEKLYKQLALLPVKETLVLIDACFSGANRENEMLIPGRGVAIKAKEEKPEGNVIAFSASTGNETAHQLSEKTHGLFTYYLLKAIQEYNGDITLGDLTDYVIRNVKRQSVVINSKRQTPTVIASPNRADNWREIKL